MPKYDVFIASGISTSTLVNRSCIVGIRQIQHKTNHVPVPYLLRLSPSVCDRPALDLVPAELARLVQLLQLRGRGGSERDDALDILLTHVCSIKIQHGGHTDTRRTKRSDVIQYSRGRDKTRGVDGTMQGTNGEDAGHQR